MNTYHFEEGIKLLKDFYNDRGMPEAFKGLLWKRFDCLDGEEWKEVCERILSFERTRPTVKEFATHAREFLDRAKERDRQLLDHRLQAKRDACGKCKGTGCRSCDCKHCDDTGHVLAYPYNQPMVLDPVRFNCPDSSCLPGKMYFNFGLPSWIDDFSKDYLIWLKPKSKTAAYYEANPGALNPTERPPQVDGFKLIGNIIKKIQDERTPPRKDED